MRRLQSNVVAINVVIWSLPTSSKRSAYASRHRFHLSMPVSSRLAEGGGEVQDGLLHNNRDEAVVVVPHHVSFLHPRRPLCLPPPSSPLPLSPLPSSSPSSPSLTRHPCHRCHHPCRPLCCCPHHRPHALSPLPPLPSSSPSLLLLARPPRHCRHCPCHPLCCCPHHW